MSVSTEILWNFPGGWTGFGAALGGCALVLAASLCFPRRRLPIPARCGLFVLRLLFFFVLLLAAALPSRQQSSTVVERRPLKVAAVFDASTSMRLPGLSGPSRLDEAVEMYRALQLPPGDVEQQFFTFSDTLVRQAGLDGVKQQTKLPPQEPEAGTHLLEVIAEAAARFDRDGTDLVVIFSDGIDTSDGDVESAAAALHASRARIALLPVTTELSMRRFLEFRRFDSPGKAVLNANVPFNAVAGYSMLAASDEVALEVVDEKGGRLFHAVGSRSGPGGEIAFSGAIPQPRIGRRELTARLLLNGQPHREVAWSCEVVERERKRVLLYQGTFDWAARFLKQGVGRSGRTDFEVRIYDRSKPNCAFPDDAGLKAYDAVVILNLNRSKCSVQLEKQLSGYLKEGGGVLFITGNPVAAGEYAASELENLLPVEFSSVLNTAPREGEATRQFKMGIKNYENSTALGSEESFIRHQEGSFQAPKLHNFVLTPAGGTHPIFRKGGDQLIVPRFCDYAFVKRLKPGAEALAVYRDLKGGEHILLALQRFGKGRSIVLATDPLWRWKLSLPSSDNDSELFWENLLAFAGNASTPGVGSWQLPDLQLPVGKPAQFRLQQESKPPKPVLRTADGSFSMPLEVTMPERGVWKAVATPDRPGVWELDSGDGAVQRFTVAVSAGNRELDALAPNLFLLSRLGSVEAETPDWSKAAAASEEKITSVEQTPLWSDWWVLTALLGIYCADLIVRRKLKLV